MAKKISFTAQQENEIALIQEETGISRKSAIRKLQRRARLAAKKAGKAPSEPVVLKGSAALAPEPLAVVAKHTATICNRGMPFKARARGRAESA